jgi:ureidoglycolate lyase
VTSVVAEPLTADAFAPFGQVLGAPAGDAHADGPGWRWWAETAYVEADAGPRMGVGHLLLEPAELRFDWAERHMRTPELIAPLGGDIAIHVAPAEHLDEPGRAPALDAYRAFRVPAGRGVLLSPGVWHAAPFAIGGPTAVMVLIAAGTGQNDLHLVRFPDAPVTITLDR